MKNKTTKRTEKKNRNKYPKEQTKRNDIRKK